VTEDELINIKNIYHTYKHGITPDTNTWYIFDTLDVSLSMSPILGWYEKLIPN